MRFFFFVNLKITILNHPGFDLYSNQIKSNHILYMKKMWRFVNFRWFNQQIDNNGNNRLRDYILILSFASLLYLNSLDADFAYDDK